MFLAVGPACGDSGHFGSRSPGWLLKLSDILFCFCFGDLTIVNTGLPSAATVDHIVGGVFCIRHDCHHHWRAAVVSGCSKDQDVKDDLYWSITPRVCACIGQQSEYSNIQICHAVMQMFLNASRDAGCVLEQHT